MQLLRPSIEPECEPLLRSFFAGGFECSCHRRDDGVRLDLIAATEHDLRCEQDYRQLRQLGLVTIRDGLRWHLIERERGRYDWSSALPMLRAAASADVQVIWDLCHYGWPDHLDIWSDEFPAAFARFAGAAARIVAGESTPPHLYCPINEISFWAWAGGDMGRFSPSATGRGAELKLQLVRATIAAIEAIREADPAARFVYAEPAIHVIADPGVPDFAGRAEELRLAQWEAWDMLSGRLHPLLGGSSSNLDILGLNFYPDNEWYVPSGGMIPCGHHHYRPLSEIVAETYARYRRPIMIAETCAEGSARPAWLQYVASEVATAQRQGIPILGICLYPILDYPGWTNGRACDVGLIGRATTDGRRQVYRPLAIELARLQRRHGFAGDPGFGA
jgi:hypothetical protein